MNYSFLAPVLSYRPSRYWIDLKSLIKHFTQGIRGIFCFSVCYISFFAIWYQTTTPFLINTFFKQQLPTWRYQCLCQDSLTAIKKKKKTANMYNGTNMLGKYLSATGWWVALLHMEIQECQSTSFSSWGLASLSFWPVGGWKRKKYGGSTFTSS